MSFDYIIEKDNSALELTKEQEGLLVKNISSTFVSLNSERAKNLESQKGWQKSHIYLNHTQTYTHTNTHIIKTALPLALCQFKP